MLTSNIIILCLIVLANGKADNCRKLVVDSDNFDAECCVFMKNNHVRHEHRKTLATVIKITVEASEDFKYKTYKFLTSLSVDSDKLYGQCIVYIKDQWDRNKSNDRIKAMVKDNLPSLLYIKMQEFNQRFNDMTGSDLFFKSKAKNFYQNNKKSSAAFDNEPHEEVSRDIEKNSLEIDQGTLLNNEKQIKTNFSPNTSFSIDILEKTSRNETNGKAGIEVGNRNAVDVPPNGCPNGKTRDPSGVCITSF